MRVALMVTCVVDMLRPSVAEAAVRVLERSGHQVDVPLDQACCGQPAWNAGYAREARRVARRTLKAFERADRIVCLAGSCATMIRVFYRELFEGELDEEWAAEVAAKTQEFSEFVARECDAPQGRLGRTVVHHDSCHMLRELGLRSEPRELLERAGCSVAATPGAERCCGFGGTFSVKLPVVSTAMADEKLAEFRASGAPVVTGCDSSCLMHLEGRARRIGSSLQFRHLAEILDEAGAARPGGEGAHG